MMELPDLPSGSKILIGGVIMLVKKIFTKATNAEMAFIKLEDLSGSMEIVIFPKTFAQFREYLVQDQIILVEGKLDFKDDRPVVLAEKISQFPSD